MTEWEPATEAEVAMRDALRIADQELYFRILARTELLLPVSADALAGRAPMGWGTWSSGGRTHVLAFTLTEAMRICLAEHAGSARRVPYHELAAAWPNHEWWLAVNPGLPIEGYLPPWFVGQLARGDVRMPGRGPTRQATHAQPPPSHQPSASYQPPPAYAAPAAHGRAHATFSQGAAAATGARREAARATATAQARSTYVPTPPPAPEEPLEAEVVDPEPTSRRDQAGNATMRRPSGSPARATARGSAAERLRRREASIIDAEIIESTVLGASALEAMVVNATVIDASKLDDVIDATVIAVSVEETQATRAVPTEAPPARRGEATGRAAARGSGRVPATSARGTSRVEPPAAAPVDEATTVFEPPTVRVQSGPALGRADRTVSVPPTEERRSTRDRVPVDDRADATVTVPSHRDTSPVPPDEATVVVSVPPAEEPREVPVETPVDYYDDYTRMAAAFGVPAEAPADESTEAPAPAVEPEPEPERPAFDWTDGVAAARAEPEPAAAAGFPSAGAPAAPAVEFVPANEVEADLLGAATSGQTDKFLSTLLLAKVLIPIPYGESTDLRPGDESFPWRREEVEGHPYLVVFTSPERMREFMGDGITAINARFIQLINNWPDESWAFAVNPGSPVGATLPGAQIKALAVWAEDVGLTDDEDFGEYDDAASAPPAASTTIIMQKPIAPSQVDYYLERGYDRASGFVHRATEVMHLHTPDKIFTTLGLSYSGTPFSREAPEVYVLRWAAHRPDLYRIPYGGPHEAAMRAMQGWMIERAPFRGNGFAPAEDGQVIAEFKVDSIRLPHGAQMWRLTSEGAKTLVAVLDSDECLWRPVRGVEGDAAWDPAVPLVSLTRSVEATSSSEAISTAKPASATNSGSAAHTTNAASTGNANTVNAANTGNAANAAPASRIPAEGRDDPLDPRWHGGAPADSGARTGDS